MIVINATILWAVLLLSAVLGLSSAWAGPATVFDVIEFGATGDAETLNTSAIQAAIDACAGAGGGTVQFPAGAYLTGTLHLKSHVRLELGAGATILGSTNVEDYPVNICAYPSRTDRYTVRALIWGEGLEDIAITGRGTIDGQGASFRDNRATPGECETNSRPLKEAGRYALNEVYANRPYLIRLVSCRNILVENVRLRNSAMWMQHYLDCDFLTIRGINVYNHGCRNNDMMDIDCCRNVAISDCVGDTDDDALTLKSTGDRATEFVTIANCILRSRCNALKAGTESSGGFRDIAVTNCVIQRSSTPGGLTGRDEGLAGIALEIVDGGSLERVAISNIVIEGTCAPIFMRLGNRARPPIPSLPKPRPGTFRNVTIDNVIATGAGVTGCAIAGLPGHPIENVTLSNIRIKFDGGGTAEHAAADVPEAEDQYPECIMFGTLPAYGFYCRHVEGLTMREIELDCEQPDMRPAMVCGDVRRLRLDGFRARAALEAPAQVILKNTEDAFITGCWADAGAFLRVEGGCTGIAAVANDLSRARVPFALDPSTGEAALRQAYNQLPEVE